MRGLIGLARLSTKDNELDLLRMWDAVSISKDQNVVRVQTDLPADLSDKLIAQVLALRGHGGAFLNAQ
jgi:energy-converting hydrogenase Eha subunit G